MTGEKLASLLLERKLAACVNILPAIDSHYLWRGHVQHDAEALLLVKTRLELFEKELVPAVRTNHPYEVPEIIALPVIAGLDSYLDWIKKETAHDTL